MRAKLVSLMLVVALIGAGTGGYLLVRDDTETFTLTADVEQAPNLFVNGRVTVRGVEVGTITKVLPRPDGVRIEMEIDQNVKVPADARLAVIPITVISDRYVQLAPAYAGGPTMADGDHIGTDRTTIPAELEDVLGQLKELLGALEPAPGERKGPLARLIREIDQTVTGREGNIRGTLQGSAAVLENLADSTSDIEGLITNLDRLFVALAARSSEIGLVNERFELVGEALLSDQDHLEGTIENIAALSDEANLLIDESGKELARGLALLRKTLTQILEHEEELVQGMKWTNVIAQGFGATGPDGRGRFAYTGLQAPPGSAGAEYNYRIDTRDTISCRRIHLVAERQAILFPNPSEEAVLSALFAHIPDEYEPHLEFLVRQLIRLCAGDIIAPPATTTALEQRTDSLVASLAQEVGRDRLARLLARWLIDGRVVAR